MDISQTPLMNEDAREDAEMERAFSEASKPAFSELIVPSQDLITLEIPPTEWFIEGLVPKGGDTFWSGPSNTYKTFICLHAIFAMSLGQKFLGHFPTNFARTLYIDEENGRKILAERLKMLGQGDIPDAFFLIEAGWKPTDEFIRDTSEYVAKCEIDLLQIDTLRRIIPAGMDENSSGDANLVTAALREIRKRSGRDHLGIWLQHHHTKPNKKEGTESTLRGSSDWTARADAHIILEADDSSNIITFKHQKLRQDRKLPPFMARVEIEKFPVTDRTKSLKFVYLSDTFTQKQQEDNKMEEDLLGIIQELNGASIQGIIDRLKGLKIHYGKRTIQRWVEDARDRRIIQRVGHGPTTKYFWIDPEAPEEKNTPLV